METDENAVKLTTLITSELQTLLKLRFGEVSPCSENNKFLSSLIKIWITIILYYYLSRHFTSVIIFFLLFLNFLLSETTIVGRDGFTISIQNDRHRYNRTNRYLHFNYVHNITFFDFFYSHSSGIFTIYLFFYIFFRDILYFMFYTLLRENFININDIAFCMKIVAKSLCHTYMLTCMFL